MFSLLLLLVILSVLSAAEVFLGPKGPRRSRRANFALIVPVLVASTITDVVVVAATSVGDDHDAGIVGWLGLRGAAAGVVAVVLLDLVAYLSHRLRHAARPLWALHRTHHTDVDMDVSTSFRHHPLDIVALNLTIAGGVAVVGASAGAVAVVSVLTAVFGLTDHARLRLPARVERIVGLVFQTPGLHRKHHSPHRHETDSNFGLVLTVWDRLLGTFTPANPIGECGLDTLDLDRRQSVGAMLAEPWRPLVKDSVTHSVEAPVLEPVA